MSAFALAYILVIGLESWKDKEKDRQGKDNRGIGVERDWNRTIGKMSEVENLFQPRPAMSVAYTIFHGYNRYQTIYLFSLSLLDFTDYW